ncbi:unnamed protein product [Nippostrongylus brasiliensis]|uniref:Lysozyme n=1 Tax=Nippostrongylus brasiliensis TaxID=27835 RepID=A0A0N4YNG8_NIPBR|nr:hypothetical protein Q1695_001916 [Nippostrongylus brasiliensis]VDL82506.1 unnamed protein product [Nippostrongylus brasiliensis]
MRPAYANCISDVKTNRKFGLRTRQTLTFLLLQAMNWPSTNGKPGGGLHDKDIADDVVDACNYQRAFWHVSSSPSHLVPC